MDDSFQAKGNGHDFKNRKMGTVRNSTWSSFYRPLLYQFQMICCRGIEIIELKPNRWTVA
jgi:hypothetical protein